MQHNVHAARPAPHIRAAHHHSHSHSHGHMQMHPGMEQHLGPGLQQQQQPPPPQQQQQPPHREHLHARLNHHHLHAQQQQQQQQQQTPSNPAAVAAGAAYHGNSASNSNQMQKIRQQHQHLSSTNSHQQPQAPPPGPPPPQAYNPAALAYNQLPPHPPPPHHMAAHLGSYAAPPPHYYMSQAKPSKYSHYSSNGSSGNSGHNNNSSSHYAPKAILQNTYRNQKVVAPAPAVVPAEVAVVSEQPPVTSNTNSSSNNNNTVKASEPEESQTREEHESTADQAPSVDECSSSSEHIDAAGTLPNEDTSSSARGGKDKTPMCLVNELARYNKITHQYRLTGERGPAHCKTFTVTLKLGEEEYSADGFKIKKAQHLAASKAIEDTKYKHPPPKIRRSDEGGPMRTHITPTVELNALAMKLGQRTFYLLDPTQIPPAEPMLPDYGGAPMLAAPSGPGMPQPPPPAYALRQRHGNGFVPIPSPPMHPAHGFYHGPGQRPFPPKFPSRFALPPPLGPHVLHGPNGPYAPVPTAPSKITLFVGKQKFVGIGRTLQQAKHDAAARALQVLKTQAISASEEALEDSMDEGDKKSPISQVHEIGIKRNMTVHFKVLREEGPAHMKNFITACIVGSIVTEGEGNGKKVSKKRAAEKMLAELQKLPPLTPTKQTPLKRIKVKTPGKNAGAGAAAGAGAVAPSGGEGVTPSGKPERRKRPNVTMKEKITETDDAENPITKLIQLQQTRKEKEPIFELIAKNGNESARRREFVMEVSASGNTARGTGNSKKLAKRNAAQALFELLEAIDFTPSNETQGSGESSSSATASAVTAPTVEATAEGEVPMVSTPAGPMPGILILRQNKKPAKKRDQVVVVKANAESKEEEALAEAPVAAAAEEDHKTSSGNAGNTSSSSSSSDSQSTEAASESALNTSSGSNTSGVSSNSSSSSSNTNSNSNNTSNSNSSGQGAGVHMKEQLLYLSKLLDFEVNFSDYPKGNHNEFLTIVTLSTNPPQICHGVGKSSEESQNDAARNALKILSELGLNNAKK